MLAESKETVTDATGRNALDTRMEVATKKPSISASTNAVPSPRALTSPVLVTVATVESVYDQVIGRPVSSVPFASLATTTTWNWSPTLTSAASGVILSAATGPSVVVPVRNGTVIAESMASPS